MIMISQICECSELVVPQLRLLVAGFPPLWYDFIPRSIHVGILWQNGTGSKFSPRASVSLANSDTTNCSIFIDQITDSM
jgi:hypothetical protein